jgi:hypothetical protein
MGCNLVSFQNPTAKESTDGSHRQNDSLAFDLPEVGENTRSGYLMLCLTLLAIIHASVLVPPESSYHTQSNRQPFIMMM